MSRIKLKIQRRDWNEIPRAKFADWNVPRHAYSSLLRKKAWQARLLYSGREKQYKSYYPLRRCLCGKILSPRLEGLGLAMFVGFLSERSAPKEEGDGNGGVIQRWCFSVDDRHPSCSHRFHQYLHVRNTLVRMCACLPSEFSHHSVSPWLLEVATSNYPAESSSFNYRRPPPPPSLPSRHCYGFFVVTLLLRATRTVSWLTRYTSIYSLR